MTWDFYRKKKHTNRKTAKKLAFTFSPRCSYMTELIPENDSQVQLLILNKQNVGKK